MFLTGLVLGIIIGTFAGAFFLGLVSMNKIDETEPR
jgi:hypothetical protein